MIILAISGSLRLASSNTALLRAAVHLAPTNVKINLYSGLGTLPHFNPDLEGAEPHSVLDFRAQLKTADGIFIASPEYAHGVTGVIKNALDWVVGSGEFVGKPVALLNAAPRAKLANEALKETLKTMDACFVEEASLTVPLPHNRINTDSIIANSEFSSILNTAILALVLSIKMKKQLLNADL